MLPGNLIRDWIVNAIEEARVVVVFVSAAGLRSQRLGPGEEMTLAAGRLSRASNKLERLIVVRIGVFSATGCRHAVTATDKVLRYRRRSGRVTARAPCRRRLRIIQAQRACRHTSRHVRDDRDRVRRYAGSADAAQKSRLVALCRSVGMPNEPVLWDELSRRHSATSEDFAPYADRQSLIEVTQDVVRGVDGTRKSNGRRPLYLRWFSHEELRQKAVRDQWARGPSILFVDSVLDSGSGLHAAPATPAAPERTPAGSGDLPASVHPAYRRLEQLIEDCLEGQEFLSDRFREWRDENGLASLAFDIPTETSLKRWLDQVLLAFDTQLVPLPSRVRRIDPADPLSVPWLSAPGTSQ